MASSTTSSSRKGFLINSLLEERQRRLVAREEGEEVRSDSNDKKMLAHENIEEDGSINVQGEADDAPEDEPLSLVNKNESPIQATEESSPKTILTNSENAVEQNNPALMANPQFLNFFSRFLAANQSNQAPSIASLAQSMEYINRLRMMNPAFHFGAFPAMPKPFGLPFLAPQPLQAFRPLTMNPRAPTLVPPPQLTALNRLICRDPPNLNVSNGHDTRNSASSSSGTSGGPVRSSNVKKYRCDVCDKTFSRSNTLITHKRIHTGEKPFRCEVCSRAFRQPGNLTRHRLTHTTVKPFVCPECDKAFNRASNLHTHMRTHLQATRLHCCPLCAKTFALKTELKTHFCTGRPL